MSSTRRLAGLGAGRGPVAGTSVTFEVQRIIAGSGTTKLHGGIPLLEGQLLPADVGNVSLCIDGSEVACYAQALNGRYSDGSVMSVLIQADATLTSGTPKQGELKLGVSPSLARLSKRTIAWPSTEQATWQSATITNMEGVFVPTDANHWGRWGGWFHRLYPMSQVSSLPYFSDWKGKWDARETNYWNAATASAGGVLDPAFATAGPGQYDRGAIYLKFCAMQAEASASTNDYYRKAVLWWARQRDAWFVNRWSGASPESGANKPSNILGTGSEPLFEAGDWNIGIASAQMWEGLTCFYLLFGDEAIPQSAIRHILSRFVSDSTFAWANDLSTKEVGDAPRFAAMVFRCFAAAARTGVIDLAAWDTNSGAAPTWREWVPLTVDHNLAGSQWSSEPLPKEKDRNVANTADVYVTAPFTALMQLDGLMQLYDLGLITGSTATTTFTRISAAADYLWTNFWQLYGKPVKSFPLRDVACQASPDAPSAAIRLNGFAPHVFAWLAARTTGTTRATWKSRAEDVLSTYTATTDDAPFPPVTPGGTSNGKELSEAYHVSPFAYTFLKEAV